MRPQRQAVRSLLLLRLRLLAILYSAVEGQQPVRRRDVPEGYILDLPTVRVPQFHCHV